MLKKSMPTLTESLTKKSEPQVTDEQIEADIRGLTYMKKRKFLELYSGRLEDKDWCAEMGLDRNSPDTRLAKRAAYLEARSEGYFDEAIMNRLI